MGLISDITGGGLSFPKRSSADSAGDSTPDSSTPVGGDDQQTAEREALDIYRRIQQRKRSNNKRSS
jgi:hypothetical protein